jgi:hypothetical protein
MREQGSNVAAEPHLDPRPWERPGCVRRDCAPHRGRLLSRLALVALACWAGSYILIIPGLVGFVLGAAVWVMAQKDLKSMERGEMDPTGREKVEQARERAFFAMLFSILGTIVGLVLLGLAAARIELSLDGPI